VTVSASGAGGATITCTGVNLVPHTKVYFGLRNDNGPNGNTMTGVDPAASSANVFRFLSTGVSTITYTSSTTINDVFHGMHAVDSRLVLTRTGGSAPGPSGGGRPRHKRQWGYGLGIPADVRHQLHVPRRRASERFIPRRAGTSLPI